MKNTHVAGLISGVVALFGAAGMTQAADAPAAAPAAAPAGAADTVRNRAIGYVMVSENRAIYETKDGKTECPQGYNDGPREQFKLRNPDEAKRTVMNTRLSFESEVWHPATTPDPLPYHYIQGNIGEGLNLDGKVGPNDLSSPLGEKGIDNNLYRAIGCTRNFRADGETSILTPQWRSRARYNTFVIELTDVDSLANDDDVTVTTYRGLDKLIADATGNSYLPGGTQTADMTFGRKFIQSFKGKIKDGVLTTEAKDLWMPTASVYDPRDGGPDTLYRAMRFQLNVAAKSADGYMGGYADIESWYYASHNTRDALHQSYGGTSGPSMYRALMKLADYAPDKNGVNTAISSALNVRFTQVFVRHPDAQVAKAPIDTSATIQTTGQRE
ncbi:MAG: hypothetical protein K1X51_00125 [Rhodospirillaceae bacterium]|nr:hypothetical protein [Rhodospirillaceae bacterium]